MRGETFVTARPITARFFLRILFVIALARRLGGIGLCWLVGRMLPSCFDFLFFKSDPIANRLSPAVFSSLLGLTIFQIRPREPPASRSSFAVGRAIAIEGMIRREIAIATLEKTLPGRKSG
ncbi:hypothetical protein Q31b_23510 [Novipirellula aureliae]|uniref:Uncharacterized protein n=1 Tax=Novipirellula aureliae TaxID=2527966 RepID=A0A5C6E0U2_9BACT|nr:hypothetical protein Q31b_23510 [Novipirellula aureliae]